MAITSFPKQSFNRKTSPSPPSVSINLSIRKSLYYKAVKLAEKKGITVQEILRNILSETISKELLS